MSRLATGKRPIGHDHHNHSHGTADLSRTRRLWLALVLTLAYMVVEAVGGWWTNSLALIADAGHMLTDVAALLLTLGAIWFASRPATSKKTFGYYRLEILAAFVNGLLLVLLSLWSFGRQAYVCGVLDGLRHIHSLPAAC